MASRRRLPQEVYKWTTKNITSHKTCDYEHQYGCVGCQTVSYSDRFRLNIHTPLPFIHTNTFYLNIIITVGLIYHEQGTSLTI